MGGMISLNLSREPHVCFELVAFWTVDGRATPLLVAITNGIEDAGSGVKSGVKACYIKTAFPASRAPSACVVTDLRKRADHPALLR